MSYAGDIGKKEGVKVYISKEKDLKVRPTLSIVYYAWNARTMSNPGYGTKSLKIMAYYSPTDGKDEYTVAEFASIDGDGSGNPNLKEGAILPCGRVISITSNSKGDHRHNTVIVEIRDEIRERLNHTVNLSYDAYVNDDGSHNNIQAMLIETK